MAGTYLSHNVGAGTISDGGTLHDVGVLNGAGTTLVILVPLMLLAWSLSPLVLTGSSYLDPLSIGSKVPSGGWWGPSYEQHLSDLRSSAH